MRAAQRHRATTSTRNRRRSAPSTRSSEDRGETAIHGRLSWQTFPTSRSLLGVGDSQPRTATCRTWSDRTVRSCMTSAARTVNRPRAQGRCYRPDRRPRRFALIRTRRAVRLTGRSSERHLCRVRGGIVRASLPTSTGSDASRQTSSVTWSTLSGSKLGACPSTAAATDHTPPAATSSDRVRWENGSPSTNQHPHSRWTTQGGPIAGAGPRFTQPWTK